MAHCLMVRNRLKIRNFDAQGRYTPRSSNPYIQPYIELKGYVKLKPSPERDYKPINQAHQIVVMRCGFDALSYGLMSKPKKERKINHVYQNNNHQPRRNKGNR